MDKDDMTQYASDGQHAKASSLTNICLLVYFSLF